MGATVFREITSCSVYWVGCIVSLASENGQEGRKEGGLLASACFLWGLGVVQRTPRDEVQLGNWFGVGVVRVVEESQWQSPAHCVLSPALRSEEMATTLSCVIKLRKLPQLKQLGSKTTGFQTQPSELQLQCRLLFQSPRHQEGSQVPSEW